MYDERLCIANVRKMRQKLHRVDELLPGLQSTLNAKTKQWSEPALKVLSSKLVTRVVGKPGIVNPLDRWMTPQADTQPASEHSRSVSVPVVAASRVPVGKGTN
jgi:hypothetical protein